MSFVTYGELLKGANGSINPQKALAKIQQITQRIAVVYPTEKICEHYGLWSNRLKQQGTHRLVAMIYGSPATLYPSMRY